MQTRSPYRYCITCIKIYLQYYRDQMEKVRIELEQLVFSTDYQVFCGIQIKNYTKYELFDPDIKTTLGSVMLPPRRIGPHEAGIVVSRK